MSSDDTPKTEHNDIPLVLRMESLDLSEASTSRCTINEVENVPRKLTLRKRVPVATGKRRVVSKPIKRLNLNSSVDIKQIYLCKKLKALRPKNLETIFEEPKVTKANELQYTALKKEKRFIVFKQNRSGKIKKKQLKFKETLFNKKLSRKTHMTMDALLNKLKEIEK